MRQGDSGRVLGRTCGSHQLHGGDFKFKIELNPTLQPIGSVSGVQLPHMPVATTWDSANAEHSSSAELVSGQCWP